MSGRRCIAVERYIARSDNINTCGGIYVPAHSQCTALNIHAARCGCYDIAECDIAGAVHCDRFGAYPRRDGQLVDAECNCHRPQIGGSSSGGDAGLCRCVGQVELVKEGVVVQGKASHGNAAASEGQRAGGIDIQVDSILSACTGDIESSNCIGEVEGIVTVAAVQRGAAAGDVESVVPGQGIDGDCARGGVYGIGAYGDNRARSNANCVRIGRGIDDDVTPTEVDRIGTRFAVNGDGVGTGQAVDHRINADVDRVDARSGAHYTAKLSGGDDVVPVAAEDIAAAAGADDRVVSAAAVNIAIAGRCDDVSPAAAVDVAGAASTGDRVSPAPAIDGYIAAFVGNRVAVAQAVDGHHGGALGVIDNIHANGGLGVGNADGISTGSAADNDVAAGEVDDVGVGGSAAFNMQRILAARAIEGGVDAGRDCVRARAADDRSCAAGDVENVVSTTAVEYGCAAAHREGIHAALAVDGRGFVIVNSDRINAQCNYRTASRNTD